MYFDGVVEDLFPELGSGQSLWWYLLMLYVLMHNVPQVLCWTEGKIKANQWHQYLHQETSYILITA